MPIPACWATESRCRPRWSGATATPPWADAGPSSPSATWTRRSSSRCSRESATGSRMRRPRSSPRSCVSGSAPPGMEHLRLAGNNVVGMTDTELDAPKTIDLTFDDLGLDARDLKALKKIGYESHLPNQAETIPTLIEGHNVHGSL